MTQYEHFWRPSRYEIISHLWIRLKDCLHSPFQLYDASLGASLRKMARNHTYKPTTYSDYNVYVLATKTTTVQTGDVKKKIDSSVLLSSENFKGDLHIEQLNSFWSSASRKLPRESKKFGREMVAGKKVHVTETCDITR